MGCYSESAARRYFCRDVGRPICGWRRSVGSKWHEGSRCRAWPSPVQLSFAGNPPYMHLVSTELAVTLICSLLLTRLDYCNSVLYSAPVSSIQVLQRVQNNATMVILRALRRDSCPAITAWAALVAHSTQNRVQGGSVDLQESQQRHSTDIPQSSHQGSRQWTDTSLVCRPTTGQAVHQDILRETSLLLFCANCLELVAWDNNQRWFTVCI